MIDPANAVHDLLTRALDRTVAATPAAIDRGINRSVKNGARALLSYGPCYRQTLLVACCMILPDVSIDESLKRAIEGQRRRGRNSHWTYDPNRLLALREHLLARRYDRRFGT